MEFVRSSLCSTAACVEFARSSFCESAGCVEVGHADEFLVRDSKNPGVVLSFTREEWIAFIQGVKAGEFDIDN